MPAPRRRCHAAARAAALLGAWLAGSSLAVAQDAAYFSPTYAASRGSPYSAVYARTFGAPPLETAAPPPAPKLALPSATALAPAPGGIPEPSVVYVIENNRLLTYDAAAYAQGKRQALAGTPLPPAEPPYGGPNPQVRVPTIADRLYAPPPLETAAGKDADGGPVPLVPQQ